MRRFPHTTRSWTKVADDGTEYRITTKHYIAVLRKPQAVYFYMLIEGPNGYHKELHGEKFVRPVLERHWAKVHLTHTEPIPLKCHLCRKEVHEN